MSPSAIPLIGLIYIVVLVLSFVSFLISPFVAWRKGYSPYLWMFACGPLGLIVIGCLPSVTTATTPEEMEIMQTRANTTGAILSAVALVLSAGLVLPALLFGA